jgi:hypothetical protein
MQNHSMQFIRFAIGMSLIAICAIGSASASSRTQVIKQEAPTNPRSISETDFRLSDRQQLLSRVLMPDSDKSRPQSNKHRRSWTALGHPQPSRLS